MPAFRCPHCALPLLPEETSGPLCPACHAPLAEAAAPPMPTPGAAPASRPVPRLSGAGLAAGALLGLTVGGIVAWLAWPARPEEDRAEAPAARPGLAAGAQAPALRADLDRAGPAADDAGRRRQAAERALRKAQARILELEGGAAEGRARLDQARSRAEGAEKKALALARALDEEKRARHADRAQAKKAVAPGATGKRTVSLDLPDGEYTVGSLGVSDHLTLTGRVMRLKVASADGNAVLDASKLQAREALSSAPSTATRPSSCGPRKRCPSARSTARPTWT